MSRFTSGGTNDAPTERDEAWLTAQRAIEADRAAKEAIGRQENGKSLYETLQANKAAKEEAFAEAARLKNQFRSLDDDEINFLDSVLESTRAKEAAVRRETAEELERFRREREERERKEVAAGLQDGEQQGTPDDVGPDWSKTGPRKRKRGPGAVNGAVKIRRASSAADVQPVASAGLGKSETVDTKAGGVLPNEATSTAQTSTTTQPSEKQKSKDEGLKTALGLADYSSDDD